MRVTALIMVGVCLLASSALAQTAEWTGVATISNGTCLDGASAVVSERPGTLNAKLFFSSGKQIADVNVPLAADGSGKVEFEGYNGAATRMEVPAGTGKRVLKSAQITGICQWNWNPK